MAPLKGASGAETPTGPGMEGDTRGSAGEKGAVFVASVTSFMTPFMGSSVNIALPQIGKTYAMDAVLMGWVTTSYLIATAVFLLPLGRASDLVGRKRIFVSGILVFTGVSLCIPLSWSATALIALRGVQGMGGAMIFGTAMAILASAVAPRRRGRAIGIATGATYAGLTAGPFLGGLLTEGLGWQSIFIVCALAGAAVFVVAARCVRPDTGAPSGGSFDLAGASVYAGALVALMLGLARVRTASGVTLLVAGAAAMGVFLLWEGRQACPLVNTALFRSNRAFTWSNAAAFIHYSATFSTSFLMSLYLQSVRGFGPSGAGVVLVTQPAVMTVLSPLAGRLSDRIEPRILASLGMIITSVGLALLASLGQGTETPWIVACLSLVGLGFSLFSSPNTNAVMSSVSPGDYGMASGVLATMRITGQSFSMAVVLLVISLFLGDRGTAHVDQEAFMTAMRTGFVFFSLLGIPGVLASLARGEVRKRPG